MYGQLICRQFMYAAYRSQTVLVGALNLQLALSITQLMLKFTSVPPIAQINSCEHFDKRSVFPSYVCVCVKRFHITIHTPTIAKSV